MATLDQTMTDTTVQQRAGDETAQAVDTGQANSTAAGGGFLPLLRAQMRRYRKVVSWFARDAYGRFLWRMAFVLAFSLLAMGGLMGALGVIFFYSRALENGTVLVYGGFEIAVRESLLLLVAAAMGGLFLFIMSFAFRYAAVLQALAIGRAYEAFCSRRAIALLGAHGGRPETSTWAGQAGRLIQSDPRYCGRVARITVNMIPPVLAFAGTFMVLIFLDPILTLSLVAILFTALPLLYVVNVRGAHHSVAMERWAKAAAKRKRELVTLNAEHGESLDPECPEMAHPFREGPIARYLDAYLGRLRASYNSELVTNVVMGISVVVILASKGTQIFLTGQGWGELAVYMVALRVNLTSVTQASKTLTSVNRFYPQVARYFRFLQEIEGLPPTRPSRPKQTFPAAALDGQDDEE
jgi:hypothetical protein